MDRIFNIISTFADVKSLICSLIVIIIVKFFYDLLSKPLNRVKNLTDLGYEHIRDECKRRGLKIRELTNELRRRKKIGSVPPVYPNGWYAIVESHEVIKGLVKSVSALGERFAVFRNLEGRVFVLDAYCSHLGADLSVGGRIFGDCLECPFHGWQYDGKNGQCVKIPYSEKAVPTTAKVKKWESKEQSGWINIWYHAENEPPSWNLPEIQQIENEQWRYIGRVEHTVACHPQDLSENLADSAHFLHLHKPSIFAGVDLRHIWSTKWQFFQHNFEGEWSEGDDQNKHTAVSCITQWINIFSKSIRLPKSDSIVRATMFGPGIIHTEIESHLRRGVFIQTITPIGPLEVLFCHRFYTERSVLPIIGKIILWSEAVMFERDIAIWNNKKFESKPILVKEDKFINRFRRWYSQFYSENSPRMFQTENSNDW